MANLHDVQSVGDYSPGQITPNIKELDYSVFFEPLPEHGMPAAAGGDTAHSVFFKIHNNGDFTVAYKFQCNREQAYFMAPCHGIMQPGESVGINAYLHEGYTSLPSDGFRILTMPVKKTDASQYELARMWRDAERLAAKTRATGDVVHQDVLGLSQSRRMREFAHWPEFVTKEWKWFVVAMLILVLITLIGVIWFWNGSRSAEKLGWFTSLPCSTCGGYWNNPVANFFQFLNFL